MPNKPHEKVRFNKRDIVCLHELPSAQAHDPVIVNAPHGRVYTYWRNHLKLLAALVFGIFALLLLAAVAIDQGLTDSFIKNRARAALSQALGEEFEAELGDAGLRLSSRGRVAFVAQDVLIEPVEEGGGTYAAESVRLNLDPLALIGGRIAVKAVELSGVKLVGGEGPGIGLSGLDNFRIDSLDQRIDEAFDALNRLAGMIKSRGTRVIRVSDVELASAAGNPQITIEQVDFDGRTAGRFDIDAMLRIGGNRVEVDVEARTTAGGGELDRFQARVSGLALDYRSQGLEERAMGLSTVLDMHFTARRSGGPGQPRLQLAVTGTPGTMTMGGVEADLQELRIVLAYISREKKIEVLPSIVRVGNTVLPLDGGLIDVDRLPESAGVPTTAPGIAYDLLIDGGIAAPADSDEAPIRFAAKAFGRFLPERDRLVADELVIATGPHSMVGSLSLNFYEGVSPQVNLDARTAELPTAAVKQLWPYWLGKKAREWVLNNLYGGTVTNGRIMLAIPAGHYPAGREAPPFAPDEFKVDFDIERARMNVAGDIPPLRDLVGHFRLRGSEVTVEVESARNYFPTGRTVDVSEGQFTIPHTDAQPLMAELDLAVSGEADAVAELITYHPIDVLDRIGLEPDQLTGKVSSRVKARFGLIQEQDPPAPEWAVDLELDGVDIDKPIEGRMFSDLRGTLAVTPTRADLDADATIDGIPLHLVVIEPVSGSDVTRERVVTGTLDDAARDKLAPGVNLLVSGPVGLRFEQKQEGEKAVALDLTAANVTIPGIGWSKGKGISGSAKFDLVSVEDGQRLENFVVSGDGFDVRGTISLAGGRFSRADLDKVQLSPGDDYHAEVTRSGTAYDIAVSGNSADLRPLIAQAKKTATSAKGAAGDYTISASGSIDSVRGFNDTRLGAVRFSYAGRNGRTERLSFKAVTSSGQATVIEIDGEGGKQETTEITSGDAGEFARFADLYGKIQGGLLNIRLTTTGAQTRQGLIDIRNFAIVGEEKLNALVSSPTGTNGRSLNDAVNRNIETQRAQFEVARARLQTGPGSLSVSDGILRGVEIGAAFEGVVYDANGQMDLSGTFMPAYGINRLFGELPLIGAILGNGRDRGLIGITFRLFGDAGAPKVEINPLSVIAPGVFRNIFEFR